MNNLDNFTNAELMNELVKRYTENPENCMGVDTRAGFIQARPISFNSPETGIVVQILKKGGVWRDLLVIDTSEEQDEPSVYVYPYADSAEPEVIPFS